MRASTTACTGDHQGVAQTRRASQVGLIEIDRTGEAVTCPTCGLEYHNQKSLEAHITAQHAQVHLDARTPFDRRAHTRQTTYDWASMERHITESRCSRLKSAAALGQSIDRVMQQVMQEERESPPKPPSSASHLDSILLTSLNSYSLALCLNSRNMPR